MPVRAVPTIAEEIDRYICTGETDPVCAAWPGGLIDREWRAHDDLRHALIAAVHQRAAGLSHEVVPGGDSVALTRTRVEPMVRGLFPRAEQDAVLAVLARSVVFLSGETIDGILRAEPWNHAAWDLANLYLGAVGADLLSEDAPRIVGLSQGTTCYVSPDYFRDEDPFADFVVHEVAHIFHNCKRRTVGLAESRRREWLLEIEYRKRETFAYACEAYARISERAANARSRIVLATEYATVARVSDERVDADEVADIVREAAAAGNGWKRIHERCAPATATSHQRAGARGSDL